jgi:septum formation protein
LASSAQGRQIVLASASPRRRQLLRQIGLKFCVARSNFPEIIQPDIPPEEQVKTISREKARRVAVGYPDAIIIAADTLGAIDGRIIGKPADVPGARQMLRGLNGRCHRVITGYTVLDTRSQKSLTRAVETLVYFRKLSLAEIESYLASGEPLDKAGAYGIQGLGAILVEKIEGDYFNVMGLPLSSLAKSLKAFGVYVL